MGEAEDMVLPVILPIGWKVRVLDADTKPEIEGVTTLQVPELERGTSNRSAKGDTTFFQTLREIDGGGGGSILGTFGAGAGATPSSSSSTIGCTFESDGDRYEAVSTRSRDCQWGVLLKPEVKEAHLFPLMKEGVALERRNRKDWDAELNQREAKRRKILPPRMHSRIVEP